MAKYLNEILAEQGSPIDFTFVARSELLTKKKKDGGTYQAYEYTFLNGGTVHKENIFPKTHDLVLTKAVKDDVCRASLNGQWVNWEILPRGEAVLSMPNPSNYQAAKSEKAVASVDREQKEKSIAICLQGFAQAYITGRAKTFHTENDDQLLASALTFAVKARTALLAKAADIASNS